MLKAINTKILLAILAALTAIGGALTYQRHEEAEAAAAPATAAALLHPRHKEAEDPKPAPAAAKAAAIPQQRQREPEQGKAEDEAFRQRVEQDKKRHNSAA